MMQVFVLISFLASISFSSAQIPSWTAIPGLETRYSNAIVNSLAAVDDTLYVGGSFYYNNEILNLAKLNTRNSLFSSVANGTTYAVMALVIRGDDLFVGGQIVPGQHFGRINRKTNQWVAVPSNGPTFGILSMCLYKNEVIMAGNFVNKIMKFTEQNTFEAMGPTGMFNDTIWWVGVLDGGLYAAGSFEIPCSKIASWIDTANTWSNCSGSKFEFDGIPWSVASNQSFSEFYVAGTMRYPQKGLIKTTNGFYQQMNATSFSFYDNQTVSVVYNVGNDFYVGGSFTYPQKRVLKLKGDSFDDQFSTGFSGIDGSIEVFLKVGNFLFAGGTVSPGLHKIKIANDPDPTPSSASFQIANFSLISMLISTILGFWF